MANREVNRHADDKARTEGEAPTQSLIFRDFGGLNTQAPRVSIDDGDFAWLENLIPISSGNAATVPADLPSGYAPGKTISYTYHANWNSTDYAIVFFTDGSAESVTLSPFGTRQTIAPAATFTNATIANWSNLGIVIVDSVAGYFDWNVTTTNTLTALSGTVSSITIGAAGSGYVSTNVPLPGAVTFIGGTGSGVAADFAVGVVSAVVTGAGAGFLVGDLVSPNFFQSSYPPSVPQPVQPTLRVTSVNGGGGITGIQIQDAGQIWPYGSARTYLGVTGGTGTGAVITWNYGVVAINLTNSGHGYTVAPSVSFSGGSGSSGTANINGVLTGSAIAVYAGRVWIAVGRTVSFTDAGSYNSFAGVGGSFTIDDDWLNGAITALFVANNFLYIFGPDSIDALSNVNVSSGITTFSRTNITASVGTTLPKSIFAFYRSVYFASTTGFYALSGATPQKVSDALDGIFPNIQFSAPVYGGQVFLRSTLCAAFMFTFVDNFRYVGSTRSVLVIFFRGKWHVVGYGQNAQFQSIVAWALGGAAALMLFTTTTSQTAFGDPSSNVSWYAQTKLWDGGDPLMDKQALKAGLLILSNPQAITTPVVTLVSDTEYASQNVALVNYESVMRWINNVGKVIPWINNTGAAVQWGANAPYTYLTGNAVTADGKRFGLTASGANQNITIAQLMVQYKNTGKIW